ncbi:6-bladed beta-propeller [Echinicola marina]|uniref:6-bladed beta-propeller n=1 Tax=Echinicola marina TaxID=2859768 RepID=UPI001CF6FBCD|nr:6-bladed beta-propeller [Echinicola marina]UCS95411.1 6-bladed beta-propeller [Echinicola marina]
MVGIHSTKTRFIIFLNLVIISIYLFGCNKAGRRDLGEKINLSRSETIKLNFLELKKDIEFITLSIPDSVYLGSIRSINSSNDYLLLHDPEIANKIYLFDKMGNYISQSKKTGEGPKEYLSLYAYATVMNSIFIYDRELRRINKYKLPHFNFEYSIPCDNYIQNLIQVPNSKNIIGVSDDFVNEEMYNGIVYFNQKMEEIEVESKFPGIIETTQFNNFSTIDDSLYYAEPLTETVYVYRNKKFIPKYHTDFGAMSIPFESVYTSEAENFYEIIAGGDYYYAIHNFNISNDLVSLNFFKKTIDEQLLGLYHLKDKKGVLIDLNEEVRDYVLNPMNVSDGYNYILLFPDEYSLATLKNLGMPDQRLNEIDLKNTIVVKFRYLDIPI